MVVEIVCMDCFLSTRLDSIAVIMLVELGTWTGCSESGTTLLDIT